MALIDDLRSALGSAYSIERELGGGGMSRVFVGEEVAFGRKVAVKVLAPELAAGVSAERFQREIKLAGQLQHPNIVPVITTGVAAGSRVSRRSLVRNFRMMICWTGIA